MIKNFKNNGYSIYDANKTVLLALIKKIGCDAEDLGIIKDNLKDTKKLILKNLKRFDLIITSGGISKSKIDEIGNFFFHSLENKFLETCASTWKTIRIWKKIKKLHSLVCQEIRLLQLLLF